MKDYQKITQTNQPPAGFDGPRACGQYELAPLLDTANFVMRTLATPPGQPQHPPSIGYDWSHVYNHKNLDNIRLITKGDLVVSSIGIFPGTTQTPRGNISVGGINCFVTHPKHRRHGLGETVLLDAHKKMKANGHHIGLLSTNIEGYYRRYGWESAGRKLKFILNRGNIDLLPDLQGVQVTYDWHPYIEQLMDLHKGERLVSPRSLELSSLLFERKLDQVLVATRKGRAIGYIGIRARDTREYGGDPEVVGGLIRTLFDNLDNPETSASTYSPGEDPTFEMTVVCPDSSNGLPGLLMSKGLPHSLEYIGMILILDALKLFEELDIRDIRLEKCEHGWILERDQKRLEVSERNLVKLIFGPELFPKFAPDIFPIEFYQWPLDRV